MVVNDEILDDAPGSPWPGLSDCLCGMERYADDRWSGGEAKHARWHLRWARDQGLRRLHGVLARTTSALTALEGKGDA